MLRTLDLQAYDGFVHCEKHPHAELVCPACAGELGGQARAMKLTWSERREIARKGGVATRGRRKRRRPAEDSTCEPIFGFVLPKPLRRRPTEDEW